MGERKKGASNEIHIIPSCFVLFVFFFWLEKNNGDVVLALVYLNILKGVRKSMIVWPL